MSSSISHKLGRIVACAVVTVAPLPAIADSPIYPSPGIYEGPATIEEVAGCCFGGKVGDTMTIAFEYKGPSAAEYKYWEMASSNPPEILKGILTVRTGRGTSFPTGSATYVGYSKPTGINRGIEGGWLATFGYFDANSFTLVLTEDLGSVTVVYDIALTRTGGAPSSP